MTARAPISDASQRVLTDRKTLHAVARLPGLERIPGSCDKVFEAEQSLTMRAQHGEACPCMDKDTHTQIALCGAVEAGGGEDELWSMTQSLTHSMMACTHILRISFWRGVRGRPPCVHGIAKGS